VRGGGGKKKRRRENFLAFWPRFVHVLQQEKGEKEKGKAINLRRVITG